MAKTVCSVPGCGTPVRARFPCPLHHRYSWSFVPGEMSIRPPPASDLTAARMPLYTTAADGMTRSSRHIAPQSGTLLFGLISDTFDSDASPPRPTPTDER